MNHKLKGYSLIHGDIISPEVAIAEFNNGISKSSIKEMVAAMNHGHEMLMVYKQHRDNMHIGNVVSMLEHMEKIYRQWDNEVFVIRREGETPGS